MLELLLALFCHAGNARYLLYSHFASYINLHTVSVLIKMYCFGTCIKTSIFHPGEMEKVSNICRETK